MTIKPASFGSNLGGRRKDTIRRSGGIGPKLNHDCIFANFFSKKSSH
jgi:hypothetical protein